MQYQACDSGKYFDQTIKANFEQNNSSVPLYLSSKWVSATPETLR